MRSLVTLVLITLTLMSTVTARFNNNDDDSGPDDALCSSYTGLNSTCSSCLIQGCTYCDTTGTGMDGLCLSHRTAHNTCNKETTLISSFSSLTQCRATQHDLYESLSAFIPITIGVIGIIVFIIILKRVRPAYAPATPTTQDVLVVSNEGSNTPLLPGSSRWILIKQKFDSTQLGRISRRGGCCFKILIVIVLKTVWILSIIAVTSKMWSIQIDGNIHHGKDLKNANNAITYDGYGMRTIIRDTQDHDHLIYRYSEYTCSNVVGDNFIRCSLHRVLAHATQSVAITALVLLCIVVIQMIWSYIRCRSLNSLSVKFMSLAALCHLTAVCIYAGGAYLLQSRAFTDSNASKAMSASPSPYQLYLGVNWDVSVAAFVLNVCLLIPLTRAHINAIPKPDKNQKGSCCWRPQQQPQQRHESIAQVPMDGTMGVAVAVPVAQVPATNPFHNPYATGATSYMSPSYQYGTLQTTPAQPAQGQPLQGFTREI